MQEVLLIALVVLLFFGGRKIPELMKGIGKGVRSFKEGMNGMEKEISPENTGTGDTPSTLSFYEHCGFRISHRLKNFFTDNYDHPIYEDGKLLTDMVYLRKDFS